MSHRVNPGLDPAGADRSCRNSGVLPKPGLALSPSHEQGEGNTFNTHRVGLVLLNLPRGIQDRISSLGDSFQRQLQAEESINPGSWELREGLVQGRNKELKPDVEMIK